MKATNKVSEFINSLIKEDPNLLDNHNITIYIKKELGSNDGMNYIKDCVFVVIEAYNKDTNLVFSDTFIEIPIVDQTEEDIINNLF